MTVYSEILGNTRRNPEWDARLEGFDIDYIPLDQWTAQKSRFLATGLSGAEYPVALRRHTQVADGDIIYYNPEEKKAAILRIELNPVLVVDLGKIAETDRDNIIRISLELGHAIGNQHWPAVVKGTKVYVPLTVDKKVMLSVMETHNFEGITFKFESGTDIIPYLAPHEIRRLFGGAGHESHEHHHDHGHIVHAHDHHHTHPMEACDQNVCPQDGSESCDRDHDQYPGC